MTETTTLIIAILGALILWTSSVVSLVLWLTNKFRGLERLFYSKMDEHRRDDDRQFTKHNIRIQRLEIKNFGFTGGNGVVIPDDGESFPGGE